MLTDALQHTVAAFYAATRAMDIEAFVATFAPDALHEAPVGTEPYHGHAGVRRFFAGVTAAFATFGLTEDFVTFTGDTAAVKWTARGVGTNGRAVTFEGIDVIEGDADGRIRHLRAYWDMGAMVAQLQGAAANPPAAPGDGVTP
jgi:steroid delta-isomerase